MIMMFEQLQDKILDWAMVKGITSNSTPLKQLEKTQEELNETKEALINLESLNDPALPFAELVNDPRIKARYEDDLADGIGDMLVTIIILAELAELDAVSCLRLAYDEIKERKGEMRDGLFVKEENL